MTAAEESDSTGSSSSAPTTTPPTRAAHTFDSRPEVVIFCTKPLQPLRYRPLAQIGAPGDHNPGRFTFGMGVDDAMENWLQQRPMPNNTSLSTILNTLFNRELCSEKAKKALE